MRKIKNISTFLMLVVASVFISSCDDSDNWKPGPQPSADNAGVYFDSKTPLNIEMYANKDGQLISDYATIILGRDDLKLSSALDIPIKVRYSADKLSIPQTVRFEAGTKTAELHIGIKNFEIGKPYSFSVEIDEQYSNPYKSSGSTRLDSKVSVVALLGVATFTPGEYSATPSPEFTPFEHKIYDNMNGTYTIKNFLYNNAGYDFVFEIDDKGTIKPLATCGFHDTAEMRWYFYSANSDASANRIPCYLPGNNPNDYITYIYFYTDMSYKYTAFWINKETQKGKMVGYSRYSVSKSARISFNIDIK